MKRNIKKIICLGDSFTAGYGVRQEESWLSILQKEIPRYQFVNRGISGDTTSGMLARLHRDVIDEAPGYALISGGANDLICMGADREEVSPKGNPSGSAATAIIKNNLMAMTHQLFVNRIKPIIASPIPCIPEMIPPVWGDFYVFSKMDDELASLNRWTKSFARGFLCSRLDLYTELAARIKKDRRKAMSLYGEGLHLSPAGHRFMADIMVPQLEEILR